MISVASGDCFQSSFDATTSLLVVSPHPDDETLCCAGAIERVAAAGGRVSVVWVTSGDGSVLSMLVVERRLFAARDADYQRQLQQAHDQAGADAQQRALNEQKYQQKQTAAAQHKADVEQRQKQAAEKAAEKQRQDEQEQQQLLKQQQEEQRQNPSGQK